VGRARNAQVSDAEKERILLISLTERGDGGCAATDVQ
jgi:hypothetical protein